MWPLIQIWPHEGLYVHICNHWNLRPQLGNYPSLKVCQQVVNRGLGSWLVDYHYDVVCPALLGGDVDHSFIWVLWMFCDICSASAFGLVGWTTAAIHPRQVVWLSTENLNQASLKPTERVVTYSVVWTLPESQLVTRAIACSPTGTTETCTTPTSSWITSRLEYFDDNLIPYSRDILCLKEDWISPFHVFDTVLMKDMYLNLILTVVP